MVCRIANVLQAHGINRGDRVAIYMPNSPQAVACMLACMRIGAIHSVVFAGFSSEALAARIQDGKYFCFVMFLADCVMQSLLYSKFFTARVLQCNTVRMWYNYNVIQSIAV